MPKAWVKERHKEYYYRKAKGEKYRSRAAYKLLQAAKKYRFIKSGDVVVDLAAAPGGWTQASRDLVGSEGFVLGMDIKRIEPVDLPNVCTITGDISAPHTVKQIMELLPSSADAVISDVSPNISGVWELDHARQIDLARKSLQIATSILKLEGNFFVKVFQGDLLNAFFEDAKQHFSWAKLVKPPASRTKSAELYILGMRLRRK